ncbi:hypothetical protein [Paraburkholderia acidipaludis]|uniref:hypothetical protein n=1 Tax=Paraburkholderia acidipaludis TaxID=660537 RepID=UPI0004808929|nr:hypothetical protein [Paraburkholderia acidipaludis]
MNLQDQIGALDAGVDQLLQAAAAEAAQPSTQADVAVEEKAQAAPAAVPAEAPQPAPAEKTTAPAPNTLKIDRPSQNQLTMEIDGKTVLLNPLQVGELIERLANVRASMQPEPPPDLPPGWRFVSTKNPAMAVQKQSNGDRLLVLRHTGHGWVPFTFTPDMVVQMYMMLTQR